MNIITKEQSDMIDLILEGNTMSDIARQLKLHRSTLYSWINKDMIKAELEERRRQLRKAAKDKITGRVNKCLDNIIEMADTSTDQRVKFNANKYLLDQCLGSPSTTKEETNTPPGKESGDTNTLKNEIDKIKNIRAIK